MADKYFQSRPYQSQIGSLCSDQSKPIKGREVLAAKEMELKAKYKEGEVPRPPLWYYLEFFLITGLLADC